MSKSLSPKRRCTIAGQSCQRAWAFLHRYILITCTSTYHKRPRAGTAFDLLIPAGERGKVSRLAPLSPLWRHVSNNHNTQGRVQRPCPRRSRPVERGVAPMPGFDQMYVHLILQPESLQAFLYPQLQITDDGLMQWFDHVVLFAPYAYGYIDLCMDGTNEIRCMGLRSHNNLRCHSKKNNSLINQTTVRSAVGRRFFSCSKPQSATTQKVKSACWDRAIHNPLFLQTSLKLHIIYQNRCTGNPTEFFGESCLQFQSWTPPDLFEHCWGGLWGEWDKNIQLMQRPLVLLRLCEKHKAISNQFCSNVHGSCPKCQKSNAC